MYRLDALTSTTVSQIGDALSADVSGAGTMEQAAGSIVRHLYDNLVSETGVRSLALARFYKTHPYADLNPELQEFARGVLGGPPEFPDVNCLTLLATVGENPDWTDRAKSQGHRSIPLASEEMVASIPMISRLLSQFGLDVRAAMRVDPAATKDLSSKSYGVFHISEADGSPYIPAQEEFVRPYGIRSVVAFGGVLSSGDLFVTIMFSKTPISDEGAQNLGALAPKPESTEGRPWGQPLKKPAGAPLNLG